ncbi:MAG: ABC transporter ATP-binding protein [Candidatus Omnitrophota bacterium]|jgi:ATP-binding cassette subfamily F protein 3|nr:MAG: ABC transporter ATP-binding protein [Candidatus Omnitrophota bacterium]
MISITEAQLRLGGNVIFFGLSWRIDIGRRIGLVGPNGAGKTSILRVLRGEITLENGRIETSKNLKIGYLPQDGAELPDQSVRDILWSAFEPLNRMEEEMHGLLHRIQNTGADTEEHEKALHRFGFLQDAFQHHGGYHRESEAKKVLLGLGFQHSDWERPVVEFSGGWRTRLLLARLLLEKPDILLLDEPTNHLDPDVLAWFEQYLHASAAGLVIVSHDRYFLDRVVTEIGEIETGRFRTFKGNYSKYREQKEILREQLLAQKRNQDREIAHLQSFIDRNRVRKDRAAQAQARMKRLEKIERIELESDQNTIAIPLPDIPRSGLDVLCLENLGHVYGDLRALHPIDATIHRGERVAVWGANGAGKSTLLSLLAREMEPTEGTVKWGYNTHVAYFSQHHAELQVSQRAVLDELSSVAPADMQTRLRDVLAAFLFRGDDVFKPVSVLSGGEKSRLALAKLLVRPVNVLIMDEPLNHLDISTTEILEETLRRFCGTIVFVSHDRFFADRLATQLWEMKCGRLRVYKGNYSDYEYAKQFERERLETNDPDADFTDNGLSNLSRQQRKEQKRLEAEERNRLNAGKREKEKKCAVIEQEINEIDQEIEQIEARMASGDFVRNPTEMSKTGKRYKALLKNREKLYAQWEKILDSLEVA